MSKRSLFMLVVLLIAFPSLLCAVGMEGMGGMGGMSGMVDKVYLQTKEVGKVPFSHSRHGTRCADCHPRLFEKKRNPNPVSMKAMENGKSCGGCHNGRKAFSVKENCTTCHAGNIRYKEKDAGDVVFSHAFHSEAFGCDACHPALFKAEKGKNKATMAEMEKGQSCGACHDGAAAFGVADACDSCHKM